MRRIDVLYTQAPYLGYRKMTAILQREGHAINSKRVRRLMQVMGLEALYCKPNTSKPHPQHHVYPYLLKGLAITVVNQVWATDITYIRLHRGWVYLVAISTGTAAMCYRGDCPRVWMYRSVWRHWMMPCHKQHRISSTQIRAASSRQRCLHQGYTRMILRSAWMVVVRIMIISSPSVSGVA